MDKQGDKMNDDSGGIFERFFRLHANGNASSDKMNVGSYNRRRSLDSGIQFTRERMTSTSGSNRDVFTASGDFIKDRSSIFSLQPLVFTESNNQRDTEHCSEYSDGYSQEMQKFSDSVRLNAPLSISFGFRHHRGQSSITSRRGRKHPLMGYSSMDCLIPKLYDDSFHFDEHLFCPFPSPTTSDARPFVTIDENRIISRSSFDLSSTARLRCVMEEEDDGDSLVGFSGLSPLPKPRTPKRKNRVSPNDKTCSSISCKASNSKAQLDEQCLHMELPH